MTALPEGIDSFLEQAGWAGARIVPLPGDASFRRYFRLHLAGAGTAMLMHAPPPHEDTSPFLAVTHWLEQNGLRAPRIMAADIAAGWVLLEDFGDWRLREWLDANPADEVEQYQVAVDTLAALHRAPRGLSPAMI